MLYLEDGVVDDTLQTVALASCIACLPPDHHILNDMRVHGTMMPSFNDHSLKGREVRVRPSSRSWGVLGLFACLRFGAQNP